jgi:CHAT domain-containing protein
MHPSHSFLARSSLVAAAFGAIAIVSTVGSQAAEDGTQLGQTLAGEPCRLVAGSDIVCGEGKELAGTLRVSPPLAAMSSGDPAARRSAILAAAKKLPGGIGAIDDVACSEHWLTPSSASSLLLFCTLRSSNWQRLILVSAAGNALRVAEGLPTMLPVLEAAIASTGHTLDPAEAQSASDLVHAKYPSDALQQHTSDYSNYSKLMESARQYGGSDNYAGAEDAYRQALDIVTRAFGADSLAVSETVIELALQVSNQGRFDEAAALFRRATPAIDAASSGTARARLASYEALDAANRGNFADALKFAREATALRRAEVDATKMPAASTTDTSADLTAPATLEGELAHGLRIESEMALRLGDTGTAQAAAEEALWIITEEPGLPLWWRPEAISLMGEVNVAQGRVVVAERDFTDALRMDQKLFGDAAPTARAHLRLGRFYASQQIYGTAVTSFRAAFAILAKDPVARSQIVSEQIIPFLVAATALEKQDPSQLSALDADVFRAVQLVNSGVADTTIARVAARRAAVNPALSELVRQYQDALKQRDNARIDLVVENARPNDERKPDQIQKLEAAFKTASANADALLLKVEHDFPDYARLADPGPAELSAVQAQLGSSEAFLDFVVGAKSGFALLVTRDSLAVRPLPVSRDGLSADVAALRSAFVPKLGRVAEFSLKSSYALYQQLLAPLETSLVGIDHLIVAPDGDLASLPMSLLVTSTPSVGYENAAWLVRRLAISQVPSPRAFLALRSARANHVAAPRPFFGVGDPAFSGGAASGRALGALASVCQQNGPVDPALLRALPRLPETAAEVQSVGRMLKAQPGSILLGARASEAAVRGAALDQYQVLYFATHAMLPGELHCQAEPGLVLSPPPTPAPTAASDGLLSASEIASLTLNADLVVLSACNTAASGSSTMGGGALEGIADSFFAAGARAVLASHWEVPSAATQKLMTGVFAHFSSDSSHDLAEALRQAQLTLIAKPATAHPFNWAAFTFIGDSGVRTRTTTIGASRVSSATGD